ncbi:MAG: chorismate synthase [Desulfonauticus sp.]|nr:chorismate synthase [Desulfonauticus sp.]
MSGDSFGKIFVLTTFGESHGPGLGGVVQGCPSGVPLTEEFIQTYLDKRKPGQGTSSTKRKEPDRVKLLSGVFEGRTTGTAIGFFIANQDARSKDYSHLKEIYRPGHADFSYEKKYGFRDYRGGGRSSGRETVSRVVGGSIARAFLNTLNIQVKAYTLELGGIRAQKLNLTNLENRPFFAADPEVIPLWEEKIKQVKVQGDTLGGIVEIRAYNVPAGLGEPVFDKLDARLAYALMGVGAVKGVEIGSGFEAAQKLGSENNDILTPDGFITNNAGGILGGVSSGQDIVARVAVKPIPSLAKKQKTINREAKEVEFSTGGRHDICAIPRIVPVLEAMVLLVLADFVLLQRRFKA